ncbi:hypothetical protein NRIC_09720 [Enterococcus florum]|uniref:Uncharacterized protein n=1 Tax=Enterococcus florum TaxID=2480627 RepID=A0A4P5PA34_9ENTE|nr:hypothetical protein NRIC_09720 [Enterococcus florum]
MDKYNAKTSFQKWFSAIKFDELSKEAKNWILQFDSYSKNWISPPQSKFCYTPFMKNYQAFAKWIVLLWIADSVKKSRLSLCAIAHSLVKPLKLVKMF